MINKFKSLYITANSPGEISGWLTPLVHALKSMSPDVSIHVLLLPCVFASGREEQVASEIDGVDGVIPADRFFPLLFRGEKPARDMALLHLGGDLMYTALLARRWRVPAWSYLWANPLWDRNYSGYFIRGEKDRQRLLRQGVAPHKIHLVGNLLADAVEMQKNASPQGGDGTSKSPHFSFLPGSRLREIRCILPFYLDVADRIRRAIPDARFSLVISPYLEKQAVRGIAETPPDIKFGGAQGIFDPERDTLTGPEGAQIRFVYTGGVPAMAESDFVITIPGTKTGEAGCLGKPMLCLLPLNRAELIPYIGLIGLLELVPIVGPFLKGKMLRKIASRTPYLSQPNMLAEDLVVPEIIGEITTSQVSERVLEILREEEGLERMKQRLLELYEPFKGSAMRMARILLGDTNRPVSEQGERSAEIRLSVIICTYNRAHLLKGALETLGRQSLSSSAYEILVVDDGSPDGTAEMVQRLELPCALRFFQKEKHSRAAARNYGLERARGDLILFVDDDILAVPELLERHLALHDSRRDIVVRGPIINIEQYEIPDAPRAQLKDYSQAFFCTCNASVRREVLREVGGFDESFVEYGWEDNEVGWRLRRRGLRACFDMEAIVYHYKPAIKAGELDKLVQQAMELGRNAVAYLHKHPHWIVRLATGIWPPNVWVKMLRYTHNRCSAWEDEWNALPQGSEVRKKALEKMIYNGHYWLAVRDELGQSGR